jgi:hypothetical protein
MDGGDSFLYERSIVDQLAAMGIEPPTSRTSRSRICMQTTRAAPTRSPDPTF